MSRKRTTFADQGKVGSPAGTGGGNLSPSDWNLYQLVDAGLKEAFALAPYVFTHIDQQIEHDKIEPKLSDHVWSFEEIAALAN